MQVSPSICSRVSILHTHLSASPTPEPEETRISTRRHVTFLQWPPDPRAVRFLGAEGQTRAWATRTCPARLFCGTKSRGSRLLLLFHIPAAGTATRDLVGHCGHPRGKLQRGLVSAASPQDYGGRLGDRRRLIESVTTTPSRYLLRERQRQQGESQGVRPGTSAPTCSWPLGPPGAGPHP